MPKGKRENYKVQLLLDRGQRKLLDRIIDVCNFAMHHAVRHALHRIETLKLVTPLEDFEHAVREFTKEANPPLFEETIKEIAKNACEIYADIMAQSDETHDQRKRRNRVSLCVVPIREVIFSVSSRVVKVPYMGTVPFRRNMFAVSSEGGVHVPQIAHKMVLGYFFNEPCLVLMTAEPLKAKAQGQVLGNQKLVKLTASEIARRKKAPGKAGPESQEPT